MVVSPRSTARVLAVLVLTMLGLHASTLAVKYGLHHDHVLGLLPLLRLNEEQSIGTWYATSTWMLAALLFAAIAAEKRAMGDRFGRYWWGLAGIATYLSIDEHLALHERTIFIAMRFIPPHGLLYWGWVVFGAAAVLVVALVYLNFLRALPRRFQRLFVASAAVFVGGAIGMEMIGGAEFETSQGGTFLYAVLVMIEEGMEMAGVAILIYALVSYIAEQLPGFAVGVAPHAGTARLPRPAAQSSPASASTYAPIPAPAYASMGRSSSPAAGAPTDDDAGGPRAA